MTHPFVEDVRKLFDKHKITAYMMVFVAKKGEEIDADSGNRLIKVTNKEVISKAQVKCAEALTDYMEEMMKEFNVQNN